MPPSLARRWLSEPLVQFIVAGAVMFGTWRLFHRPAADPWRIEVTPAFVEGLRADASRRSGHPPTKEELQGLIDRYVDEEVLYRHALELGLDRGDVIVRRRLIEKMEFLTEDSTPAPEVPDEELRQWMASHRDQFQEPERLSFEQLFFDPARHPDAGSIDEADPFPTGRTWKRRSQAEIAATFGDAFAAALVALPSSDTWSEPIRSSFGVHRVRVTERVAASLPTLDTTRPRVLQSWLSEHRPQRAAKNLAELRSKFTVIQP